MQAAKDLVSYLNNALEPEGGTASGPIQTRSLQMLDLWQQVLVKIAPAAMPSLVHLLIAYVSKSNAKVKIKKGNTSIEVPAGKISDEQMKKLIDSMTKERTGDAPKK